MVKQNDISALLRDNSYPGRGIVTGLSADGRRLLFAYFIMGRSENSRNRVFVEETRALRIYPADSSKVDDPSLIIYAPFRVSEDGRYWIVSNGDQTDTIYAYLREGKRFEDALQSRCFEPDAPNFTPRISALLNIGGDAGYQLSILKATDAEGGHCGRYVYSYEAEAGVGHFIHTYEHDGSPLPSFEGEPRRIALPDTAGELAELVWDKLNAENKIALYARSYELAGGREDAVLYNKFKRVDG